MTNNNFAPLRNAATEERVGATTGGFDGKAYRSRIKIVRLDEIKLNPVNPRRHSAKQIRQIADSFAVFGFTNPLLVSEDLELIAGHGRYEAAKLRGLWEAPVLVVAGLSPAKRRALAIADNKLTENSSWDRQRLAIEIPELTQLLSVEGLDISILGFEPIEIEQLRFAADEPAVHRHDRIDAEWGGVAGISRPNDLWNLGSHRLLCGDGLSTGNLERLMGGDRADTAFIDPPGDAQSRDAANLGAILKACSGVFARGRSSLRMHALARPRRARGGGGEESWTHAGRGRLGKAGVFSGAEVSRPVRAHWRAPDWLKRSTRRMPIAPRPTRSIECLALPRRSLASRKLSAIASLERASAPSRAHRRRHEGLHASQRRHT